MTESFVLLAAFLFRVVDRVVRRLVGLVSVAAAAAVAADMSSV